MKNQTLNTSPGITELTPEEELMQIEITLLSKEVIPGVKPLQVNELSKCDIFYYMKLIRFSKKQNYDHNVEAYVDEVGI